jgi:hypothetical protein
MPNPMNKEIEDLQKTMMEGVQSSVKIDYAFNFGILIRFINWFSAMGDLRFISSVEALEDNLASFLDDDYVKTVSEAKTISDAALDKKLKTARQLDNKKEMESQAAWQMARIKYREMHRLICRVGLAPYMDAVEDVE